MWQERISPALWIIDKHGCSYAYEVDDCGAGVGYRRRTLKHARMPSTTKRKMPTTQSAHAAICMFHLKNGETPHATIAFIVQIQIDSLYIPTPKQHFNKQSISEARTRRKSLSVLSDSLVSKIQCGFSEFPSIRCFIVYLSFRLPLLGVYGLCVH